jgi:hypothetical protein
MTRICALFTKIYKWAQKFLSIEAIGRRRRLLQEQLGKFRGAVAQRISLFLDFMQQNHRARILFLILSFVPPFLIFLLAVLLPVVINPFDESTRDDLTNVAEFATDSTMAEISQGRRELSQKILALEIEEEYWRARLQLAKSDSIGLAVDLTDSVVSLEVKGVPMRVCKIYRYKMSGATRRLRAQGRLREWISQPFILQKELATLPKAPIRIKAAPEDTIEAQKSEDDEIPLERRDVHFTLHFDRNLTIAVAQVQTPSFGGWLRKIFYGLRRNFSAAGEALWALIRLKLPQHRIEIELELSREDAKAIYRALPPKAGLALRT